MNLYNLLNKFNLFYDYLSAMNLCSCMVFSIARVCPKRDLVRRDIFYIFNFLFIFLFRQHWILVRHMTVIHSSMGILVKIAIGRNWRSANISNIVIPRESTVLTSPLSLAISRFM